MRTLLDDPAFIENQDEVRFHDTLNPMGDDKCCPVRHEVIQGTSNLGFCLSIHTGG